MSYEGRREHLNYGRSAFGGGSLHVLFEKLQSVIDLILLFFFILFGSSARLCKTLLMVGCFGFNGPLRQCFSLYRAVSQREGGVVGWSEGAG